MKLFGYNDHYVFLKHFIVPKSKLDPELGAIFCSYFGSMNLNGFNYFAPPEQWCVFFIFIFEESHSTNSVR